MIKQGFTHVAFVCGVTLAGLAAIHFIWLHPAVIGPFALGIGMTPLVVLFAFSLEISAYWFLVGTVLAGILVGPGLGIRPVLWPSTSSFENQSSMGSGIGRIEPPPDFLNSRTR